jgi:3-phenylpropionate/trans-cinnamate dioxygenase ferredoxin component
MSAGEDGMGEYIGVGKADEVGEGDAADFEVEGAQIAVARIEGKLYAFADICTHMGCTLVPGGDIDGTEIQCGCHGSTFSIETGAVIEGPATQPIEVYPSREVDGEIQIEV